MLRLLSALLLTLAGLAVSLPALAASVNLEELTSPEVRARIAGGATTMLIPIGGTEQSGPYLTLGKHNVRVRLLAEQIAQQLGNALVAPVLAYVPEGQIHPPSGHMRFSGTISISESAFEALLEGVAASFRQHGIRDIVFLGDHGDYQRNLQRVAMRLNRAWAADPGCRVHALPEYYRAAATGYTALLQKHSFSAAEIGTHAGLADTALTMALDKSQVRSEAMARAAKPGEPDGVSGDPRRATAELGQLGVQEIVQASVAAIRRAIQTR